MVGGLVEQKNIRLLHQRFDNRQASCASHRTSAAVRISESSKPARRSASAVRKPRSVSGTPDFASVDSITERTVSLGSNSEICETQLSLVPLRMATSPLSACTRPCRISSRVDLPEPFGPIRPMRSPSDTVNEIFRKSGAIPYRLDKPCALIIGGKLWSVLLN